MGQKPRIRKLIIDHLKAKNGEDAIREIAQYLGAEGALPQHISSKTLIAEVTGREGKQTTGLGNGLAFPHARIRDWEGGLLLAIGFSRQGINFSSIDGRPVHAVFLMISSTDEPYAVLQTMSAIVRALHGFKMPVDGTFQEQILERISGIDHRDNGKIIYASDIMIPVRDYVTPDMSVEDVAHLMHIKQLDVVPVVEDDKYYCGEISSLYLFRIGMPEFFKNLPTISFVRHIDPFEKYFHVKGSLKAKDIMDNTEHPFTQDKTLLEIIFELTVKKRQRIFILDSQRRLEGMIDRFCILDKILFF